MGKTSLATRFVEVLVMPDGTATERAEERRVAAAQRADVAAALALQTAQYQDRLVSIIEADHRVIESNTAAMCSLLTTLQGLGETMRLLVAQVTTSINKSSDGVPLKVFMIVVVVMAAIIAVTIGVDITALRDVAP